MGVGVRLGGRGDLCVKGRNVFERMVAEGECLDKLEGK